MNTMAELDKVINPLVNVVRPIVQHIEAQPAIAKDHYSTYMAAIDKISAMLPNNTGKGRTTYLAIGIAFERAGANKAGVRAALRIMGVL